MVRSISDADRAGDQKGERQRDHQRIVEQRRIVGADQLLHDEGRVGAEHHHLAMRHVDDAHDAEGDGEADGGEQQHRAERQPVPGVLHRGPDRQAVLDRCLGRAARLRPPSGGWPAGSPSSRPAHPDRRGRGSRRWRRSCRRGLASLLTEDDGGARLVRCAGLTRGSFSSASALSSAGSALSSRDLNTACAASKRRFGIGRHQRQRAERGVDAHCAAGC